MNLYDASSGTLSWHQVLRPWIQGSKTGSVGLTGEPTWNASRRLQQ